MVCPAEKAEYFVPFTIILKIFYSATKKEKFFFLRHNFFGAGRRNARFFSRRQPRRRLCCLLLVQPISRACVPALSRRYRCIVLPLAAAALRVPGRIVILDLALLFRLKTKNVFPRFGKNLWADRMRFS